MPMRAPGGDAPLGPSCCSLAAPAPLPQVWTVEQSSAKELLGSQWVERHKDFVEGYGEQYHNVAWMPLVKMLQVGRRAV